MPPFTIDPTELWAAIRRLADENDHSWRFTKKGDKRPAYDVEAGLAAKRAKLKIRQEIAIERTLAAARERNRRRAGPDGSIPERMLKAMHVGEWYGMGDLMRLVGADRTARGKVHQVMLKRGWIEKARNPAFTGEPMSPQAIAAGGEPQPQHLYRMTPAGEAHQRGLQRA